MCNVCPHYCELHNGETGKCKIYRNINGTIVNTGDGKCSALSVDAIEKRPLFHYLPGSKCLSAGWYGCSLFCKFCYNFEVSQSSDGDYYAISPESLISITKDKQSEVIAFTYNEPTLYYEFICNVPNVVPVVIKSNGFANKHIFDKLFQRVNAFNIDIKGDEEEYQSVCGGSFRYVKESIEHISKSRRHLEISFIVLPRIINNYSFLNEVRDWLVDLDQNIPLHLLYYYPYYQMHDEQYSTEQLVELRDFFHEGLSYVYISNLYKNNILHFRNTYCSQCKQLMVKREIGIDIIKTKCCERILPGVF